MIHFGTGGFRGVIGDDFTKENVKRIAQAISDVIHEDNSKKPVVIGYDFRFGSDAFAIYRANTLAANNIPVILASGPTPTPAVRAVSKAMDNDFGIRITASHNPYYFNGVKLFQGQGMDAEVSLTDKVENKVQALKEYKTRNYEDALKEGKIVKKDILTPFLENIRNFLHPTKEPSHRLHVLFDPIYGTGALTLRSIANDLNIDADRIHSAHDAFFGHRLPNPIEENLIEDKKLILENHYDLAIGTDSDCDRIAILDEKGNYVDANEVRACIYYYLVKFLGRKGDCIKNIATSNLLDAVSEKLGFHCHRVDVGFKNISAGIKEHDALIGGESSGGLTIRGYIFGKDSSFASALFLEMVKARDKPVSEIVKEVRDFANFHSVRIEDSYTFRYRENVFAAGQNRMPGFESSPKEKICLNNNFKYLFDDGGWAMIRFSGTEPLCRIRAESPDINITKKRIEVLKDFLAKADHE